MAKVGSRPRKLEITQAFCVEITQKGDLPNKEMELPDEMGKFGYAAAEIVTNVAIHR